MFHFQIIIKSSLKSSLNSFTILLPTTFQLISILNMSNSNSLSNSDLVLQECDNLFKKNEYKSLIKLFEENIAEVLFYRRDDMKRKYDTVFSTKDANFCFDPNADRMIVNPEKLLLFDQQEQFDKFLACCQKYSDLALINKQSKQVELFGSFVYDFAYFLLWNYCINFLRKFILSVPTEFMKYVFEAIMEVNKLKCWQSENVQRPNYEQTDWPVENVWMSVLYVVQFDGLPICKDFSFENLKNLILKFKGFKWMSKYVLQDIFELALSKSTNHNRELNSILYTLKSIYPEFDMYNYPNENEFDLKTYLKISQIFPKVGESWNKPQQIECKDLHRVISIKGKQYCYKNFEIIDLDLVKLKRLLDLNYDVKWLSNQKLNLSADDNSKIIKLLLVVKLSQAIFNE